jgi:hypothetical protein
MKVDFRHQNLIVKKILNARSESLAEDSEHYLKKKETYLADYQLVIKQAENRNG